jgi:carbonic anhydrase
MACIVQVIEVNTQSDILPEYQDSPIGKLLQYHNLGRHLEHHDKAQLLVSMCMDNRKQLRIPKNFAFVIRTGGGNLVFSEFKVSFAIAIGGVKAIALIAHTQCGMVGLRNRRDAFVEGLVRNAGWERDRAAGHFEQFVSVFELADEKAFVLGEAKRLQEKYPRILVAPLLYKVEDDRLYQLSEAE